MIGVIGTIFLISLSVLAGIQMKDQVTFAQGNNSEMSEDKSMMTMSSSGGTSLPQPNANGTLLKVEASNAIFEPGVGLTNVFGPEGLFPFTDVFNCANALTCGV